MTESEHIKPRFRRAGEPKVYFTPEMIKEVEVLAGRGLTQKQIAYYYGIGTTTLDSYCKKNPEIRKALMRGKAKTISFVSGQLMDQIRSGSTAATIFYLKCQGRWKDPNIVREEQNDDEQADEKPKRFKTGTKDPNEAARIYQQIMLKD